MRKEHPKQALLFVWTCDLVAIAIFATYWFVYSPELSDLFTPSFIIWIVLLCLARHGGLFKFVDSKISAGLGNVFEFAALIILPFPLFVLSIIISCFINIASRIQKKHNEPFLGPDFNAANVIIGGLLSIWVFNGVVNMFQGSDLTFTIALFLQAMVFEAFLLIMLNTLISLDEKTPWKEGPAIKSDALITGGILIITGSLLATTYLYNPYLPLFFIVPAILLQGLLKNANKANLVYIDEKTGIYNYRYFDEKINELYINCKKQGKSLSLVFGDMDYLRDVNNNFGHSAGDEAITAIGQVFKRRQQDKFISARFGGEEFVMILPNTDKKTAYIQAEAVRQMVEELDMHSEEKVKIPLTISLGVASYPEDAEDIHSLIQASDEALYEAKKNGRNRVCIYGRNNEKSKGNDNINQKQESSHALFT